MLLIRIADEIPNIDRFSIYILKISHPPQYDPLLLIVMLSEFDMAAICNKFMDKILDINIGLIYLCFIFQMLETPQKSVLSTEQTQGRKLSSRKKLFTSIPDIPFEVGQYFF